jgi:RNA polymerase sigma-70 factor (ECF subfamily)
MNETAATFHDWFVELFDAHFQRLFRVLDRESGDPDLAADLAQETFIRLYRRGAPPDLPSAWLIAVALNLFRNERASLERRKRLLSARRTESLHSDPAPSPEEAAMTESERRRVRAALERLPDRERQMLLLKAEGFRYSEIAAALHIKEASIGTLLARATQAFRELYGATPDAS